MSLTGNVSTHLNLAGGVQKIPGHGYHWFPHQSKSTLRQLRPENIACALTYGEALVRGFL